MRPFRFAVQASGAATGAAWCDLARKVEDLGYSTLYIPDHLDDQWAPMVAATAAAQVTTTLRVGPLVLDNDFRHPLVAAKEAATLDLLSRGRLELGMGAGWLRSDYQSSGLTMDPAAVRVERLGESLAIMRSLWTEGRATSNGPHYRVENAVGTPRPHTPGGPQLVVGGGGRKILSLAARTADVVSIIPSLSAGVLGPEVAASAVEELFHERIGWVREAAGERMGDLELQSWTATVQVVPDAQAVLAAVAPVFGLAPEQLAASPTVLVGPVEQLIDTIRRRREVFGFSYVVVHEPELELFAPVVAELAGT